jgi:hypothetical protein
MAGDPQNAAVWANADVFIGATTATLPVDSTSGDLTGAAFGSDWDAVGLLNGDDGFTESYDMDSDDFYAWGGILIATTRRNFKLMRKFTAYEDNPTMTSLLWPGSDITFDGSGGYAGKIRTPDLQHKFKIGFDTYTGGQLQRVVSTNYAQVEERGDKKQGESDLESIEVTVTIYPDADGNLFDTFKGAKG